MAVIQNPCPSCAKAQSEELICGRCQSSPPPWESAAIPWHFKGLIRHLIHQFKYHQDFSAGNALVECWLQLNNTAETPDAILFVPMHHQRQHHKGFNQAQWFASKVAKRLNCPALNIIKRTRPTPTLEGLTKKERQAALKDAFQFTATPPKHVSIIDDVMTSGATLSELTRLAKRRGCERVSIWAFALTPLN